MSSAFLSLDDKDTVSLLDETSLWSAPFGQMLLDAVPCRNGIRFLDIGPGTGFPLLELAQRIDGSDACGIDPWEQGRVRIESKIALMGLKNVSVINGVAEDLPFADGLFDLVVSNNGLNNVADIAKVLSECRRVMKKNAQLVFTINLPGSFREFYTVFKSVLRKKKLPHLVASVDDHIRSKRLPENEWLRLLKKNRFRRITTKKSSFSFRFSSAEALFEHFFMQVAFVPPWEEIVGPDEREMVFEEIKRELNRKAEKAGGIRLTIPMICFNCCK